MTWKKLGLICEPEGTGYSETHCAIPTPLKLDNSTLRIYYATRQKTNNFSRIMFVDVDSHNPTKVLRKSKELVLDIGEPGNFADCGVQPICVLKDRNKYLMYYVGFSRGERNAYSIFSGRAISDREARNFTPLSKVPFLDRTQSEPLIRAAPFVEREGNYYWRIYYISDTGWFTLPSGKRAPKYQMMTGTSIYSDFSCDDDHFEPILEPNFENDEIGFGRPWKNGHKMYFSVRKTEGNDMAYTHIESVNVRNFKRNNNVELERSASGWDSKMCCFASVVDLPGGKFMIYNGNGYGENGFGLAKLVKE